MELSKELDVAVKVVHLVCSLCQRVQTSLLSSNVDQVKSKDDDSLVTVADYSVQAVVSWILSEHFGSQNISIVAEEDSESLTKSDSSGILTAVVKTVNECFSDAPKYGVKCPVSPLTPNQVIEAIRHCSSSGGQKGRHWVLDPVDGTLGFVRGNQYAVALALIEDGKVILGVLGCPNYPVKNGLINQQHQSTPAISPTSLDMWEKGCVMYAKLGTGKAWMQPLLQGELKLDSMKFAKPIRVSSIEDPALATFCEPVERANTSHSFSEGLAHSVGFRRKPLRVYSMVKYAAIARGDAEVYMKFARAGYKEKIWDHAAGVLIVQEAGGVVTDAGGRPLDFSKGIYLEGLDRGIIACSGAVLHDKIISAVYASWESSVL
ncbi:hypothetical protein RND81_09G026800 [Saponaria officinalis]|uniref:3'(2'),5'-bisphosphate nucleotidase n=1 Tax=Saponaria officinalis TaxID=3572 RepID=A0AAW1IHU5_SAPOF